MAKRKKKRSSEDAASRAPKGSGSIEQRANGKWRVIVSGNDPVTGKRTRLSRTFDTQREAVVFKDEAEIPLQKKIRADSAGLTSQKHKPSPHGSTSG
jgi:hypothetical protein